MLTDAELTNKHIRFRDPHELQYPIPHFEHPHVRLFQGISNLWYYALSQSLTPNNQY